jgi:hypothetical protein
MMARHFVLACLFAETLAIRNPFSAKRQSERLFFLRRQINRLSNDEFYGP